MNICSGTVSGQLNITAQSSTSGPPSLKSCEGPVTCLPVFLHPPLFPGPRAPWAKKEDSKENPEVSDYLRSLTEAETWQEF